MRSLIYILPLSLLAACASGPCKGQVRNTEPVPAASQPAAAVTAPAPADNSKVIVYRPDGSRQCSQRVATGLKVMEKELTNAGIKVLSSSKKRDGMMHTQVCGAATGMANTYEINSSDLKKAETLGFNRLEI